MRKFPRFISKQIGRVVPAKSLFKIPSPVFLPFYHVVSNHSLPHILNYNYRNEIQFEKELDFYLTHFRPLSLSELLEGPHPSPKTFHLSFDDGLKECAEIIAPLLLKKGIQATFFVNPGFIDNRALFHKYKASLLFTEIKKKDKNPAKQLLKQNGLEGVKILNASILQSEILDKAAKLLEVDFNDFLSKNRPYLSTKQLNDLKKQGFTIGVHSYNHPEFWKFPEEKQIEEVQKSMEWLVQNVNPHKKVFSFPFTDSGVSPGVLEKLKTNQICDATFGTAGLKYDEIETHFQRYPVEMPGNFVANLKAEWSYFILRKLIGKETVRH
ncbi:MAG: polysaccharide deacetylase family protein [Prolixibacteraceae bacterium]|nr:polysaccharide deacetylase family protein [Prolixibacteraceae bacterium]